MAWHFKVFRDQRDYSKYVWKFFPIAFTGALHQALSQRGRVFTTGAPHFRFTEFPVGCREDRCFLFLHLHYVV